MLVNFSDYIRNLVQTEGFLGLYRGLFAHCLGVIPARYNNNNNIILLFFLFLLFFSLIRTIHFLVYSSCKGFLSQRWNDHPYFVPMFSSSFAAASVVTITSPIWLVKTRLQLQANQATETVLNDKLMF